MKILFFIGTLSSGGKERRLIELMSGLSNNYNFEILLILAFNQIDYKYFYELGINYIVINKKPKSKSIKFFFQLDKIVKDFNPDIIHTWGSMQTFYMLPSSILRRIPLMNSQITDAPLRTTKRPFFQRIINKVNFRFSTINLANSYAGLESYGIKNERNSRVIHNGFDLKRISKLEDIANIKKKLKIKTKYVVLMVGAFAERKDYKTYLFVADKITKNISEVSFLGIGDGRYLDNYRTKYYKNSRMILPGRMSNVESIINASDVCVLMTNGDVHGEGISNSIMEYMALGKPVIASDSGGTSEIIQNNKTGFVISNKSDVELEEKILSLLKDEMRKKRMGELGKQRVIEKFSIETMTNSFVDLYKEILK